MPGTKTKTITPSMMYFIRDGKNTPKIRLEIEPGGCGIVVCSGRRNAISGAWSISKSEMDGIIGASDGKPVRSLSEVRQKTRQLDGLLTFKGNLTAVPAVRIYLVGNTCPVLEVQKLGQYNHQVSPLSIDTLCKVTFEEKTLQFRESRK